MQDGIIEKGFSRGGSVRPVNPSGRLTDRAAAAYCNTLARLAPLCDEAAERLSWVVARLRDETAAEQQRQLDWLEAHAEELA